MSLEIHWYCSHPESQISPSPSLLKRGVISDRVTYHVSPVLKASGTIKNDLFYDTQLMLTRQRVLLYKNIFRQSSSDY